VAPAKDAVDAMRKATKAKALDPVRRRNVDLETICLFWDIADLLSRKRPVETGGRMPRAEIESRGHTSGARVRLTAAGIALRAEKPAPDIVHEASHVGPLIPRRTGKCGYKMFPGA
jgi:hypothetical protein